MTAANFFVKPGYQARTEPAYYADIHDDGTIWQPDVYPLAAVLAYQYECRYIIDIGCGRGRKLVALHPEFEIVGLDFGSNFEYCRDHYPFGHWFEVDLENGGGVDIPPEILRQAVVINSDVIEHLVNPTGLMQLISSYLVHAKVALISTPERDLERGYQDMGPPANPTHIREWNLAELIALLSNAGLRPAYAGLTLNNDRDRMYKTSLAVIPGQSLTPSEARDLGVFCEQWLGASPEQREAAHPRHLSGLTHGDAAAAPAASPLELGTRHIDKGEYDEAFQVLTGALEKKTAATPIPAILFQLGRLAAFRQLDGDARELFYQAAVRDVELTKDIVDFYIDQVTRARSGQR
ncbi:class I SAM-dependent methyltransferase [Massilia sp. Dwa41.01b]|uniref:methyltransferase domain-containing protein n=1 Tax=unclassified Massilia TaxID=2609279 RepID=UPI0015FF63ED|nr:MULTISPECIES: methyltransferase domain-containing protein [unclassified Massilia]QNA88229.1 class I SAM-dependent methyltransferase [Massilia sp. Dwa41.01b]QNA99128.1 class I SAM-dependent methyltransferase [Massilia sp. Se16.2.3]